MVKGISKQVIVVHSPEEKLFEQAIFILNEKAIGGEGVTEANLLKQANKLLNNKSIERKVQIRFGALWALAGAVAVGVLWLLTAII